MRKMPNRKIIAYCEERVKINNRWMTVRFAAVLFLLGLAAVAVPNGASANRNGKWSR